jgi:Type IV pilin-like G and H, putative
MNQLMNQLINLLKWKTLGTVAIVTLPIVLFNPSAAQSQNTIEAANREGGRAVAMFNRYQQAYFLEESQFSQTLQGLRTGLPRFTDNHRYMMSRTRSNPTHYAIARRPEVKSFVGRVVLTTLNLEMTTHAIICENNTPGVLVPPSPRIDTNLKLICAPGTTEWTFSSNGTPEQLNSEGKTYVGSLNRAQQAYMIENDRFSTTLESLGAGVPSSTIAYDYSLDAKPKFSLQYGIARRNDVKSYVGIVERTFNNVISEETTIAVLCENILPGPIRPPAPILLGGGQAPVCAAGTQIVR